MNTLPDAGYLLDQLLSSTLDYIYFKDLQSRMIICNQACAVKHGWNSPAEGIGKTDFDVFAPEHAEKAYADEQQIIATGIPMMGMTEEEAWPDGHITWCSTTKMPLRDEDGTIIGIFGVTRDITERKEAELRAERYARQVEDIKDEMEEDALMAGKLQQGFSRSDYPVFPEGADAENGCIEFLHHINKCSVVSGDYFTIRRISESKVGLLLCDVLGTGARAALGAALIRGITQEIEPLADDPSAYLGRMSELLYPLLHPEPDRLLLDVTACYMVLDISTGLVRVASAAHPLPLHFSKGRPVKWLFENLVLRGPSLAEGGKARYRTIECRLEADDSIVLFTEGLFSVMNAQKNPFSEKRLLGAAQGLAGESLEAVFKGLEDAALSFSKEQHFSHDVFLVGFHLRKLMESP